MVALYPTTPKETMSYEYGCTLFDRAASTFFVITLSNGSPVIYEGPAEDELTPLEITDIDMFTDRAVIAYLSDGRLIYVPSYSSEYSLNPVITTWMTRQQAHAHTAEVWNRDLSTEAQGARWDPYKPVEDPDLPALYDPADFDDSMPTNIDIRSLVVDGVTYV